MNLTKAEECWSRGFLSLCISILVGCGVVYAADLPAHIRLSFKTDPSRTMIITWETTRGDYAPYVKAGLASGEYTRQALGNKYPAPNVSDVWINFAELTGLMPNTTYYYVCGNDQGGWSEEGVFKTAPDYADDFVFTIFGSHGFSVPASSAVNRATQANTALHLIAGDVACVSPYLFQWDLYLNMIQPLSSIAPLLPCKGDEDREEDIWGNDLGYTSFHGRFILPGNEQWYSFDWGQVHFVALDTLSPFEQASEQYDWLNNDLYFASIDPLTHWIIVYMHHSPYIHQGGNEQIQQHLVPLFEEHGVDVVFSAHEHFYERTFPLKENMVTDSNQNLYDEPEGIIYVVTGGGGRGLSDVGPDYYIATKKKEYNLCKVSIDKAGILNLKAIQSERGEVLDEFTITKYGAATNTPTPRPSPTITPTPDHTYTPSPTATQQAPKFSYMLAGYWNTRLSKGERGMLSMLAFAANTNIKQVEIFYQGDATDIYLFDNGSQGDYGAGDGIFGLQLNLSASETSVIPSQTLLELNGYDQSWNIIGSFPYLTVN